MTVHFTSDLHFGHDRVAEIRGFGSAATHDATLGYRWETTVGPEDVVYVLGDISGGSSAATRRALGILKGLPGRKRLIAGNHDPIHPMNRDAQKWFPEFMDVFESVAPFGRIRIPVEGIDGSFNRVEVLLSHFPYHIDRGNPRYTQYRLRDEGMRLLHGHLHSSSRYTSPIETHVGVDAWDLAPVSMDEIARRI